MRFTLFAFLSIFFIGTQFSKAQTYYEHYQDGLVVFQIKLDAKRILSTDQQVDFKNNPLFTTYLNGYAIEEVKHLHPKIDDELLNRVYQIKLSDFSEVDEVIKKLSVHSTIEYAELKELHHTTLVPDDQFYGLPNQYGLFKIQAEQAWDVSTGSSNVIVAVTDNAINVDHPDLQNIIVGGYDAVDQDNDPRPCGGNDGLHGSHVSGTVGCETDNNTGIASIGFGISIMPVKIGDCSGSLTGGYDGIVYAANNGANIINMSWGGPGFSNYGQNVINNAWNAGAILVAAAGNDNTTNMFYPAGYNNVVTVASTNETDNKSGFSNYGNWIDVAAPGSNIISTDDGNYYVSLGGTSMASPLVSGLLGLMKSYAPSASNTDLINCLYSSADDISAQNSGYIGQLGSGRINAFEALNCLSSFNVQYDASIRSINSPVGTICSNTIVPEIEIRNNGSTTITSATITYDWGGPIRTFNWTGSLSTGQVETVTLPTETLAGGTYVFSATITAPNGQTDQNPGNNNLTTNFVINTSGEEVTLNLNTDCWGSETTWEITDDNNNVVASGGPYADVAGGASFTYNLCLSNACFTFSITDDYGDGMSGAQYQSCATNGDYEMINSNGDVLFDMTAANGDFGGSSDHPFCLVSSIQDDAAITGIDSPTGILCTASVQPVVRLQNFGANPLTSVTINYQTSGGVQTFSWTGNLTSNQSELVTLPVITTANGLQTITAYTSNPNGNTDGNTANDQSQSSINIQNTGASLPFIEDFESNVFVNGKWGVVNPDNSTTWERVTVGASTPGSNAAKIDFFNYQQSGRRDGMISPKVDLSGVTDADMTFEHAYRRFNQNAADSLIIYVSTDCAVSWTRVFAAAEDGTGSFATQSTNTTEFSPSVAEDWCFAGTLGASCFTVNLDAFVGNEVFVKFESYNAGPIGNNLFIDNININGTPSNLPPVPSFSASTQQVCVGETVNFSDQSSNAPTSWNWTFPGGSPATSTAENPSIAYPISGTYDVTLEVSNASGTQTTSFTNEITVNVLPSVNLAATELTICEGESTSLTASGASSYTWNNGLGSGNAKTVSPTTTTTYEVTGLVGNCSNTATVQVTVDPAVNLALTASQTEICVGSSVTLSASGANAYTWNNGLGTGNSQSVSPTATTTYSVTGSNGSCTDNTSITVEVNQVPTVSATATELTICEGESTDLSASGASSYTWNNGLGNGGTQSVSPTATTVYEVTGANGSCSNTATVEVTVTPGIIVSLTASQTEICLGSTVTLSAGGANTYTWNNGLGTGSSQSVAPTSTTSYSTVGSDGNCTNTASVTVVVNDVPNLQLSAINNTICEGDNVTINANGADSYVWSPGSSLNTTNGSSVVASPTTATIYTVLGSNTCGTATETISISVNSAPAVPTISQNGNTLSVNLIPGETAQWFLNGNNVGSGSSITLMQDGNYEVVITNSSGCSSSANGNFNRDTSSLAQNDLKNQLLIYPNPTQGTVQVKLDGAESIESVRVYDAIGREVLNFSGIEKKELTLDFTPFETGVYVVRIKTGSNTISKKITKR
jgi:subtilisin family serine protease/PKD repeat protein